MLHNFIELFGSQEKLSDKWILLLVFLFPIAGPVVRHWNSILFILLAFTALYFLFTKKDRKILYKEEKIYLWTFFLFFLLFLVSTISNGYSWEKIQVEGLGTEIDFLLFIPIYLLVRENGNMKKALFAGILLSIPVIFLFSFYEYRYVWPTSVNNGLIGAYSQLFLGPITALSLLMSYYAYQQWFGSDKRWLILTPFLILMGLFTIIFSEARIAYLTIFFGSFIVMLLQMKSLKLTLVASLLIMLSFIFTYQFDAVRLRTDTAFKNISNYFNNSTNVLTGTNTSVGQRLEVWRSSQYIVKEHPFIGIGNGNYPAVIQKYIDQDLVSSYVRSMGHAHNTFFEALISKGIIGLVLLLMILYFPVYIAWKNKKKAHLSFVTITAFASALTLMSTGESMLINKNNGVSYLLIFSAVLFSSLMHEINSTTK